MSSFYEDMQATAEEMIAEFGMLGILRRVTSTAGPYEPDLSDTTFTDYACKLVVTDYGLRERESSLIEANDRKVLVAAKGLEIEPQEEDALLIGAAEFAIVNVRAVSPGGTVVVYEIQARS